MIEKQLPRLWRVGGNDWGVTTSLSGSGDCNVYLLALEGARVLIDCGTLEGRRLIESNIAEAGVKADELTDLLLTHSHYDHTQAASQWQGCRVGISGDITFIHGATAAHRLENTGFKYELFGFYYDK